jgi:hypothetical protein
MLYLYFRAHSAFIDDCLDAFIVGACMHHLEMESIESEPQCRQDLFEAISSADKMQFLEHIASEIQKKYINLENGMLFIDKLDEKPMFSVRQGPQNFTGHSV